MPAYGLDEAAADFLLIVIVGINCYMGWRFGLVRRAISFMAVFAGAVSAYYVGNPLAALVKPGDLIANAWAFVGVFTVAVLMIEILAWLYSEQISKVITVIFDRVSGLAAGVVVGVLEAGVLFLVAQAVADTPPSASDVPSDSRTAAATAVDHGLLTQLVVKLEPGIQSLLSPALPGRLQDRLADSSTT